MRKKLYTAEVIRDDQTVEPWFDLNWRLPAPRARQAGVHTSGYGVEIPRHQGDNRGSFAWDPPPIKDLDRDFDKLRFRTFKVDREGTQRDLDRANDIFSRKSDPTTICTRFHEEEVREEIRHTPAVAGGCNLELIMKDTPTFQNDPRRIARWVQIAREETERFLGGRKH